jgi:hypothetical protein
MVMEAVHISEKWEYFNETTWCYIPESCHLEVNFPSSLISFCMLSFPEVQLEFMSPNNA